MACIVGELFDIPLTALLVVTGLTLEADYPPRSILPPGEKGGLCYTW
jgi:hypothetical protein